MEDYIQNNKLNILGKLTAGLLHEIRNPLTAIKLNLDYMKMLENELTGELAESVTSSLEAFERVHFIIEDVLDFTRKSNNKICRTCINNITERSLEIISIAASKRGIRIIKEFDTSIPRIVANENKLLQIFINLIGNAIEASKDKSNIFIRTKIYSNSNESKVLWEVEDFGCGIKPEDKQKILEGYFTNKMHGNGIGLTVCKRLLDEINAEFHFESEYGKGSRFYIIFKSEKITE